AMMDHPNIAKVLDAGATATGRPYFVMEMVRGEPITEYCDKQKLGIEDRLRLFQQTCNAVQHAHQKGIIHRDIKPSNVMITLHDGKPVPKVIDFGIAKATSQRLTEKTVYTEYRQLIGTPEYMSPEQAEMSGIDIDTRSDVYSLGVLLYELLTGTTPFDSGQLRSAAYGEIQRIIREETPHRPSTRLTSLHTLPTVAEQRRAEPGKLPQIIRGDLDWIVMKAMEKDRTRRYDTASDFAKDLQRYLDDEPVLASPPSAGYRLGKFIRRNKVAMAVASLIVLVLVLGVIGTSWGMVRAIDEKQRADDAASAEAEARVEAEDNARRAERELARAVEIKRLITEMLSGITPARARGADTTLLRGILEDAAARLDRDEVSDELVAAELHLLIGRVYESLGRPQDAEPHVAVALEIRRRVLGNEHPDTLTNLHALAMVYWNLNRFAEGERLYLEALEIKRRVLGEDHPETLRALGNVAVIYIQQRRYAEAQPLQQQAFERRRHVLGAEHPSTLNAMGNLAFLYHQMRRHTQAEPLYVGAVELQTKVMGATHPLTLDTMRSLGAFYVDQGRFAEAEPLLAGTLDAQRRVLGSDHPDTHRCAYLLVQLLIEQGRLEEAEQLLRKTLDVQRRLEGDGHPYTLHSVASLGRLYNAMGRYDDARATIEPSLETMQGFLGRRDPHTRRAMGELARAYLNLGRPGDAVPLLRDLLQVQREMSGAPDADAHTLNEAAWTILAIEPARVDALRDLVDPERARQLAERACEREQRDGGKILWMYLDTLAQAQHRTGDTAAAIETQRRAIALVPESGAAVLRPGLERRLEEYEAALSSAASAGPSRQRLAVSDESDTRIGLLAPIVGSAGTRRCRITARSTSIHCATMRSAALGGPAGRNAVAR
ncbi:MAG: tetratricopeptide repeat protein, partial [Planctomycetota bacterium]